MSAPTFADTYASELLKLRSGRAPVRNLVVGTALGVVLSALVALVARLTWDDWTAADRADFGPLGPALVGVLAVTLFTVIAAVGTVTSEYGTGMIRTTFTVTPRRGRVLAAKALAVATATAFTGVMAMLGMIAAAEVVLLGTDVDTAGLTSGVTWETVARMGVVLPVFPVMAVAVAFLLRSVAASLAAVLAINIAPAIFGGLLPDWWRRNLLGLAPGPVSDTIGLGHLVESDLDRPLPVAVAVLAAWVAVFLWAAHTRLVRTDADR